MKKQINLFFDFEFTSLSPDAQPISLGIVSDTFWDSKLGDDDISYSKSFYAEFSDFNLSRCDECVKENVVSKLKYIISHYHAEHVMCGSFNSDSILKCPDFYISSKDGLTQCLGNTYNIKRYLKKWLKQFKDYDIQFICDCGTFDFYYLLQLIGEWDEIPNSFVIPTSCIPADKTITDFMNEWKNSPLVFVNSHPEIVKINNCRIGLPKLPPNISPVPQDLNDLIAIKKGISVKEAFELDREGIIINLIEYTEKKYKPRNINESKIGDNTIFDKHNALWDAKIIKAIYESLK